MQTTYFEIVMMYFSNASHIMKVLINERVECRYSLNPFSKTTMSDYCKINSIKFFSSFKQIVVSRS
uniref:Uncharacterized protein n=1 Tax=Rhizophora mucronata TaxID=61149 RepID=A0A2P2IR55_RHIMU